MEFVDADCLSNLAVVAGRLRLLSNAVAVAADSVVAVQATD